MANIPSYGCTRCNKPKGRDELVVKRVQFVGMGVGADILRSRVTDWLCPDCIVEDPDYLREKFHPPRMSELNAS